jgi:hypothetical protein
LIILFAVLLVRYSHIRQNNIPPKRFDLDFSLLEPLSLLLLALSFGCGFRRLYLAAFGTHINHDLNDADEKSWPDS